MGLRERRRGWKGDIERGEEAGEGIKRDERRLERGYREMRGS